MPNNPLVALESGVSVIRLIPPHNCALCPRLVESRRTIVYSAGPQPAELLVVAQAPGKQEENANPPQPLIGWSGKKLQYLATEVAGYKWDQVRRTNVVLCRPPYGTGGDLPPKPDEIRACSPYLLSEIECTDPKLIVALGAVATKWFFPKSTFKSIRGKVSPWTHPNGKTYNVCPMLHPAAAAPGRNAGLYKTMEAEWGGLQKKEKPGSYFLVTGSEARILFQTHYMEPFAFDLETKNNHWPPEGVEVEKANDRTFQAIRSEIIGWSFCFEPGTAYYCTDSVESIRVPLEAPEWPTIVHNALFEYTVLRSGGITLAGFEDTKMMAAVLGKTSTNLKDLAATELGIRQTLFKEVDWNDLEAVTQYAAADADYTLRLFTQLHAELVAGGGGMLDVYRRIDLPVVSALSEAERDGFRIDLEGLGKLRDSVRDTREDTINSLNQCGAPPGINFGSGKQLGEWLYGPPEGGHWEVTSELKSRTHLRRVPPGLGLPVRARTETGQPKTDIATLHLLEHPVAELLIKLSSADQFLSGHSRSFQFLVQEDGRVHPSYHLSGHWEADDEDKALPPSTARLSSTGPNAQQITNYGDDSRPYVYEWGQDLRRCIIPAPGFVFVEFDFAQQEPRIAAMVSGDAYMDHLLNTADVYRPAAADLYHCSLEDVTRDMRQIGKRAWMAWLNRAGPAGIKKSAWWLSDSEARAWISIQDAKYETFSRWCWETFEYVIKHGYVETYFGRRIYFPQSASKHSADREAVRRACVPGVIQGTGADVFKLTLKAVHPYVRSIGGRIPLLVHDAVVTELPNNLALEAIAHIKGLSAGLMPSPLPLEAWMGESWSKKDMKEVK